MSKLENETQINFNDEENIASVYTHNKSLQRKLAKLAETNPDCILLKDSQVFESRETPGARDCRVFPN